MRITFRLALLLVTGVVLTGIGIAPTHAEGSRNLFPSGITGSRANLEWRTNSYGPAPNYILRRTLLHVYANAGEYILVGSSAVGVGSGDILIFDPGKVGGQIGQEIIPATPDFKASSQAGRGKITSRALELAGPKNISGTGNTGGYTPAYYQAPSAGIYSVVIYGTAGGNSNADGGPTGDVALASSTNFDTTQGTSVSAWDVTVRTSTTSTTDINGRLFSYYLALFTGGNGRLVYSTIYPVTLDGYQYRTSMNGLDPNGFVMYGNLQGYFDSDGSSPLYHDVLGNDGTLSTVQGGVSLALPQYPIFFSDPNGATDADTTLMSLGIPTAPTTPTMSAPSFTGTVSGNTSKVNSGGTFKFTTNVTGIYQITISRDGVNFDPSNTNNRALRGYLGAAGNQTVVWDGKDNLGNYFPVGNNYPAHLELHAGEYHFPLIDAENSIYGGPSITMENATNPLGQSQGFYDDRGYKTVGGTTIGTVGAVLCGLNPPATPNANTLTGFDTTTTQRAFGANPGSNTNVSCTGSFGDAKGLDIWTYRPSSAVSTTFNIVAAAPQILLVKRITAINGTVINGYVDDPNDTNDNNALWPTPLSTYLRGAISVSNVKPGDSVEYTIYFLNSGTSAATNISICDVITANLTYDSKAFNGLTPTDGGLPADQGMALALSSTALPTAPTNYLTNLSDSDRGTFYAPGTQAPAAANQAGGFSSPLPASQNVSGVVCYNVVTSPTTLPNATAAGTPTNSYGFVRFRVKVK